jgi:hypothetical protein
VLGFHDQYLKSNFSICTLNLSQNFDVHLDSTKPKHIHEHSPQYHSRHQQSILHTHNLNFKDVYLVCTILLHLIPTSIPNTRYRNALPPSLTLTSTSTHRARPTQHTTGLQAIHSPLGLDVWPVTTFGFSSETSLLC